MKLTVTPQVVYEVIRKHLTPDLLKPKYKNKLSKSKFSGHCYVASEAFFYLVGGKANGYSSMFVHHENSPHWWIMGPNGSRWDLTKEQFSTPVPYEKSTGKGFLTKTPCKRTLKLLNRLSKFSIS